MRRLAELVTFLVALCITPAAADEPVWLEYAPTVVTLRGFIVDKEFYGPPNYGETPELDQKIGNWLLLLAKPINVRGGDPRDDNPEAVGVTRIVVTSISRKDDRNVLEQLKRYLGREVDVTGTLYHGDTVRYWVNTAMDVQKVSLAPRSQTRDE